MAVREVCASRSFQTRHASISDLTPEVLQAFAEGFYLPMHKGKVAFGGIFRKLKELVSVFTKVPQLWEKFKDLLGIESLSDIPSAIKDWAKRGYQALRHVVEYMFHKWPLKLYTIEKGKLMGVNHLIERLMAKIPEFERWLKTNVRPKVDQLEDWMREYAPTITKVLLVAIYIWIWVNVVEFEWDMKSLTDAMTGNLSLADLLASLPASALGFMLNSFGVGTFTLLPVNIAIRILFLMAHHYIDWSGRDFTVNQDLLAKDFGVTPQEVAV